jgi:hypothetical protein
MTQKRVYEGTEIIQIIIRHFPVGRQVQSNLRKTSSEAPKKGRRYEPVLADEEIKSNFG